MYLAIRRMLASFPVAVLAVVQMLGTALVVL
jgi:hypothetical protein